MRQADWVEKMWATIEAHSGVEFEWGVNDCCLFSARVVDAMTATDHELDLQAEYNDEATALAYISACGSLQAAVSQHLGNPVGGRALRGDVVLVDGGAGDALGICVGSTVACLRQTGLDYLPRTEILARWAIE